MVRNADVLLSPAEYQARQARGFAGSVCVVFDVLRATSVVVTGLANGARSFVPVEEISEALAWHERSPGGLLAGERNGLRIMAAGDARIDFDLGNSPREYIPDRVRDRDIVATTTNGTRALRACATAKVVAASSFLNLRATARWLASRPEQQLNLICAGTGERAGLEDILATGALLELLCQADTKLALGDEAKLALLAYQQVAGNLAEVVAMGQNGARLLANADLRADVAFCLQRDIFDLVAVMGPDGKISAMK
jgi:2-phosphosulfolactate phosphatase